MNKNVSVSILLALLLIGGAWHYSFLKKSGNAPLAADTALAARFDRLSKSGNSSCSAAFTNSLDSMSDSARLQGSCCSAMDMHRYSEQVMGLEKYKGIPEIPSDPYDVDAGLAKKLKGYYDLPLTSEEQQAYDYAMTHSDEKGPCCCKCWRWQVYGGLGKYLIKHYQFTGEQLTEVWNLSDGCGGGDEHHHSSPSAPLRAS